MSGHCKVFTGLKLEAYTVWYEAIHTKGFDYLLTNLNQGRRGATDSTYCRGAVFPGSLSKDTAWWRWLRWWWRLPAITANNRWTQPLLPPGTASLIYKRASGSHTRFHRS